MSKNTTTANISASSSDLLIYQAPDGKIKIDVRLEGGDGLAVSVSHGPTVRQKQADYLGA